MHHYWLHLGSNEGDRKKNILKAIEAIRNSVGDVISQSNLFETEPWGLKDQPYFINVAIEITSSKSPEDVLKLTKVIESELGRKTTVKWGQRCIDIDILYCDDLIITSEKIQIPHPELYHRNFVLIPMMEISGDKVDPQKHMTIDDIYLESTDSSEVLLYEDE
ncbi:MAG: 2-amino-4-hydroxy-6-hydroxymethyldihydropteridine diphosphokinase [Saprospiraceae bacterium]